MFSGASSFYLNFGFSLRFSLVSKPFNTGNEINKQAKTTSSISNSFLVYLIHTLSKNNVGFIIFQQLFHFSYIFACCTVTKPDVAMSASDF